MDWLAIYLRQRKEWKEQPSTDIFVTDYIHSKALNSKDNKKYFFRLLQFLSFLHTLKGLKRAIDYEQVYYVFQFPVSEFLSFLNLKRNQYKRTYLIDFLDSLQRLDPLVILNFADKYYRSYVCFPFVKIEKENNIWMAKLTIVRELSDHCYPFLFPANFLSSNSQYDIDVRLELICTMTQLSVEKIFHCENFLNQYKISNKNIQKIEAKFKVIHRDGSFQETTEFTLKLLNQSSLIYFYEKISENK